ncbi:unnamed protein product [Didymodactylos carnosus]|uniref:Uncharacterized protein n=1 Tax=Didymodactylos carnosus TaxID=1234261 RepID=A0A815A920_9BILA|nr:unnamed protein product [Didymodactylos carnosus]CAF4025490.1 unnamed protein product [Didymodactylos carnosus]
MTLRTLDITFGKKPFRQKTIRHGEMSCAVSPTGEMSCAVSPTGEMSYAVENSDSSWKSFYNIESKNCLLQGYGDDLTAICKGNDRKYIVKKLMVFIKEIDKTLKDLTSEIIIHLIGINTYNQYGQHTVDNYDSACA